MMRLEANHLELEMESNRVAASCSRFWRTILVTWIGGENNVTYNRGILVKKLIIFGYGHDAVLQLFQLWLYLTVIDNLQE